VCGIDTQHRIGELTPKHLLFRFRRQRKALDILCVPDRGADILVRVEKLLDDAGKAAGKTSSNDPSKQPATPITSGALAFPENYIAAAGDPPAPQRKN